LVNSSADAAGRVIGAVSGTAGETYAAAYGDARVYQSYDAMLGDLRSGVIDCAIADSEVVSTVLKGQRGVRTLSEPLLSHSFAFAVAKEDRDLKLAINAALAKLRESETLQQVVSRYITGSGYSYVSPEDVDRSAGTITLAIDESFSPYSYFGADGAPYGLDVEVARAVCDLLGVDVTFVPTASDKLITNVRFGKVDFASGGLYATEADAELVDFTEPYTVCTQSIIVRK
jgi:polar amino acid transport system substrate-binding protein